MEQFKESTRANLNGAANKADNLATATTQALRSQMADVQDRVSDVTKQAKHYGDKATQLVERHPIYAVAGAAAIGFLVGAMFSRK